MGSKSGNDTEYGESRGAASYRPGFPLKLVSICWIVGHAPFHRMCFEALPAGVEKIRAFVMARARPPARHLNETPYRFRIVFCRLLTHRFLRLCCRT